jgi:hypothetical protein
MAHRTVHMTGARRGLESCRCISGRGARAQLTLSAASISISVALLAPTFVPLPVGTGASAESIAVSKVRVNGGCWQNQFLSTVMADAVACIVTATDARVCRI